MNGVHPFPAPSLRELLSECEAEGVYPDGSTGPMVTRKPLLALKFLTVCKHQSTPPLRTGAGATSPIMAITRPLDILSAGG